MVLHLDKPTQTLANKFMAYTWGGLIISLLLGLFGALSLSGNYSEAGEVGGTGTLILSKASFLVFLLSSVSGAYASWMFYKTLPHFRKVASVCLGLGFVVMFIGSLISFNSPFGVAPKISDYYSGVASYSVTLIPVLSSQSFLLSSVLLALGTILAGYRGGFLNIARFVTIIVPLIYIFYTAKIDFDFSLEQDMTTYAMYHVLTISAKGAIIPAIILLALFSLIGWGWFKYQYTMPKPQEFMEIASEYKEVQIPNAAKKMGISFAAIWALNILSLLGIALFWNKGGAKGMLDILFWLGYPIIIFAIMMAIKFNKVLKSAGAKGSNLILTGIILLFFSLSLSLTNFLGVSIVIGSNVKEWEFLILLSMVAIFLYTVSTILICIGTNKLYRALPGLHISRYGAYALLAVSIILSPLTIGLVNAETHGSAVFNAICILAYAASAGCLIFPWFNPMKPAPERKEPYIPEEIPEPVQIVVPELPKMPAQASVSEMEEVVYQPAATESKNEFDDIAPQPTFLQKYGKWIIGVIILAALAVGGTLYFMNRSAHKAPSSESDSNDSVISANKGDEMSSEDEKAIAQFVNSIPDFKMIKDGYTEKYEEVFKKCGFDISYNTYLGYDPEYDSSYDIKMITATLRLDDNHFCQFREFYDEEGKTGWTMEIIGAPDKLKAFGKEAKAYMDNLKREYPDDWYLDESEVITTGNFVTMSYPMGD